MRGLYIFIYFIYIYLFFKVFTGTYMYAIQLPSGIIPRHCSCAFKDVAKFWQNLICHHQASVLSSSQYSMNSIQKPDDENEANLLAVLTETLDSIPVDEDGLPSFDALTNGDVTSENEASPSSVPGSSPPPQETEETSLLKKLLLAPANIQLNYNECSGLGTRNHANSNHRIRTNPALAKTENSWSNKAKSTCQPQKPQRRPCSELLKYLTTSDDLSQAKQTENRHSNRDKYTSKKKALLHSQMHHLQGSGIPLYPQNFNLKLSTADLTPFLRGL
uniref:SWIM-type domain-containing protein n=1 Tax=Laticauda laticaudata TaxID=8630 RepID=A0A8C5SS27_LATLA